MSTSAEVGVPGAPKPRLGRDTVRDLVRTLLDDRTAEISGWTEQPLHGGVSNSLVARLQGVAAATHGPQPWSLVVKYLQVDANDAWQVRGLEPSHWRYWKRDWHVYQASWLSSLDPDFGPPRIYGVGELDPSTAWIAMEFLTPPTERWSPERFPQVARILGRMNGRFLTGRPLPDEPWLTRDYIRMYVDSAEPVLNHLTELAKAPLVRDIYPPDAVADLQAFWTDREQFYAALAACPQVFSHFDVFTRNAFLTENGTGRLQVTAVDWELCGVVPVGGELGSLTGASLAFLDLSPDIAEEVTQACLNAYLAGLADVDAVVSPVQVEFAALTTNAMRNALGLAGPVISILLDPKLHPMVEQIVGVSLPAFVENTTATIQILRAQIDRARMLLAELPPPPAEPVDPSG